MVPWGVLKHEPIGMLCTTVGIGLAIHYLVLMPLPDTLDSCNYGGSASVGMGWAADELGGPCLSRRSGKYHVRGIECTPVIHSSSAIHASRHGENFVILNDT